MYLINIAKYIIYIYFTIENLCVVMKQPQIREFSK